MFAATSILAGAAGVAMLAVPAYAQLSGLQIAAFPEEGCDYSGDFSYFPIGQGYPTCSTYYFAGQGFPQNGSLFEAYMDIPDPGEDCQIFIRAPANVDDPQCGLIQNVFSAPICRQVFLRDPFDINWCCGGDQCDEALGSSRQLTRREQREADEAKVKARAEAKRQAEIQAKAKAKRAAEVLAIRGGPRPALTPEMVNALQGRQTNCQFNQVGEDFTISGEPQRASDDIICNASEGCGASLSRSVTTSTSNTFGITVGVGAAFEVISLSAEFSYEYTYEESKDVTIMIEYNIQNGDSGYLTWSPTLECKTGSFSGSDCGNFKGTETNITPDEQGDACIPVEAMGGIPVGTPIFRYFN